MYRSKETLQQAPNNTRKYPLRPTASDKKYSKPQNHIKNNCYNIYSFKAGPAITKTIGSRQTSHQARVPATVKEAVLYHDRT